VKKQDVRSQQAIWHGSGVQVLPGKYVPTVDGHWKIVTITQGWPGRQHAPRQGLGEQVLPGAAIVLAGHCAPVKEMHVPSSWQQARTCGQGGGVAEQVMPGKTPPPAIRQRSGLVLRQPVPWQQQAKLKVWPQTALGQVPLAVKLPPRAEQLGWWVTTQVMTPVMGLW
jgi:hypothetical protein